MKAYDVEKLNEKVKPCKLLIIKENSVKKHFKLEVFLKRISPIFINELALF
jgi:hypothetical protein